jgi:hypothetical protein
MVRETKMPYDFVTGEPIYIEKLKAFEALVRADERERVMNEPLTKAQWQRFEDEIRADEQEKYKWDVHSCGPTCKRYACVAMREAVEAEREACAKVCEDLEVWNMDDPGSSAAKVIRSRNNK